MAAVGVLLYVADLVVDVAHAAPVDAAHNVGQREATLFQLDLDDGVHVHVIEQHQPAAPIFTSMNHPILAYGLADTMQDEGRERQRLAGALFVFMQNLPRLGHVELDQPVDHVLAAAGVHGVEHQPPRARVGLKREARFVLFGHLNLRPKGTASDRSRNS